MSDTTVKSGDHAALLAEYIELNMSNYGPDDVDALNAWGIRAYDFLTGATAPDAVPVERDELEQRITDALARYLRVCRSGGMSSTLSNSISAAVSDMLRLDYLELALAGMVSRVRPAAEPSAAPHATLSRPVYVFLEPGDTILAADELLADDMKSWSAVGDGLFTNSPYLSGMKPMRRLVPAKAPVDVPTHVMDALDRMCTPLDNSVLAGATADADAHSMRVIRDYVVATPPLASQGPVKAWFIETGGSAPDDSFVTSHRGGAQRWREKGAKVTPLVPQVERGVENALNAANTWISGTPHGDNCYVSAQYAGDPGNRCNCGKETVRAVIERAFEGSPVAAHEEGVENDGN